MLEFHHVTSSYFLLHAKWSIRQASYITTCSFKITKPARMNHLMLCSQIELNVISAGLSELTYISMQLRSTSIHCLVTTTKFHFYCWNKHIYAISASKINSCLITQKACLVFYVMFVWALLNTSLIYCTGLNPETLQKATPAQTEEWINTAAGVRHFAVWTMSHLALNINLMIFHRCELGFAYSSYDDLTVFLDIPLLFSIGLTHTLIHMLVFCIVSLKGCINIYLWIISDDKPKLS